MDIHRPKPAHSWREFLTELGTIICGILIALALEQTVEAFHWAERVKDAEVDMQSELTTDDGPQAYARIAQSPCIAAQLEDMRNALLSERDQHVPLKVKSLTTPTFWTWDRNAYDQAMVSGVMTHMPVERAYHWSAPYSLEDALNAASKKEASDYGDLADAASAPAHPSDVLRERLLAAVSRARADNALITDLSKRLIELAKFPGIVLTEQQKRLDLDQDQSFPKCRPAPKL